MPSWIILGVLLLFLLWCKLFLEFFLHAASCSFSSLVLLPSSFFPLLSSLLPLQFPPYNFWQWNWIIWFLRGVVNLVKVLLVLMKTWVNYFFLLVKVQLVSWESHSKWKHPTLMQCWFISPNIECYNFGCHPICICNVGLHFLC